MKHVRTFKAGRSDLGFCETRKNTNASQRLMCNLIAFLIGVVIFRRVFLVVSGKTLSRACASIKSIKKTLCRSGGRRINYVSL